MIQKYRDFSEAEKEKAFSSLDNYFDSKVLNDSSNGIGWGVVNHKIQHLTRHRDSLKRSVLCDVEIISSSFINCAMTGSHFSNVKFLNSMLDGNNLLSTVFIDCEFINDELKCNLVNNSFSQSQFYNCTFRNIQFEASTISQSLFSNCIFENCVFASVTLENTKFDNCKMSNLDLSSLNLEFIKMTDNILDNVRFPFYQFYYIIGSVDILKSNTDISFKAGDIVTNCLEYEKCKEPLIIYYSERQAYFPMINILIAENNMEMAKKCLIDGISLAIKLNDFRMIKHFCRLGKEYSLIDSELSQQIISKVDSSIIEDNYNSNQSSNIIEQRLIHSGEIRQLLMTDGAGKQILQLSITTNISQNANRKINKLQNKIQKILDKYGNGAEIKFIETRHNSPYELFVQVVSNTEMLLSISAMVIAAATSFGRFIFKHSKGDKNPLEKIKRDVTSKYQKDVDVASEDKITILKERINSRIRDIKDKVNKSNDGKINRYINSITQKIIGEIDSTFPDKQYIIFTTKKS